MDHAIELLDHHAVALSRRARKPLTELLDSVETFVESIDNDWCDGVCSDQNAVEELSGHMAGVQTLSASSEASEVVSIVRELLSCVGRCGSVVLRSISALTSDGVCTEGQLNALEALRNLSESRQVEISDEEVRAFNCVKQQLAKPRAPS